MDTNTSYIIANGSDAIPAENDSDSVACREDTPYSYELLQNQSNAQLIFIVILWLCVIVNLANFLEEVVFIIRRFQISLRKQKTLYVLGLMPVHAVCAIIGVMVPRASILVELVANSYIGFAMYNWMGLIDNYLDTEKRAQARGVTVISLATPPCCCFCVCLPKYTFNKKTYLKLLIMVYQVTLIRPILAFIASVLWADGQYVPGKLGNNAFTYVSCLNTLSTMFAVWGLIIVQRAFRETLKEFSLFLKFFVIQLTLLGTVLSNIIITILVSKGVIQCTELISTGAKAARMDNTAIVFWMLGLALLGRIAFRRENDGLREKLTDPERSVLPTDNGSTAIVEDEPYTTDPDEVTIVENKSPGDLNKNV